MKLVIGDKNLSSWSLRPWLVLKVFNIPFEEIKIWLDQPDTNQKILKYSPSGKVPCLLDKSLVLPESLAICEYLNDKYPDKKMWPQDVAKRAWARSISNEMHGGFQNLRTHMPHKIKERYPGFDTWKANTDIARIEKIWTDCRETHRGQGSFLFGDFSIADAMYAPVVNRFRAYDVKGSPWVKEYMNTMLKHPMMLEWEVEALKEVRPANS
ncbi:MAG: glutathione S-transferase family protein [Pseudobdellovibrionaceae bacterium]